MQFGIPTLIEHESLAETAALCREFGFRFVELNMNMPQYQLEAMDAVKMKEIAQEYGIGYTLHLDENLNVTDFNPAVAQSWRETVIKAIRFAQEMEIPVLNMHLNRGVYFTLPEKRVFLYEKYEESYMAGMLAFREECQRGIGQSGIHICVENTDGYPEWQMRALDRLLESPAFGLTYDVGHDHAAGRRDGALIQARKNSLMHMHLHDARANGENHLPLGSGEMDIRHCLDLAKTQNCRVVVETKTVQGLWRSARWLKENGYLVK